MLVLGIESSCDETGVALYDTKQGLLEDALFSQIELHQVYGGVVPEIASRDHVKRLLPMIRSVLGDRHPSTIDGVAYTAGPGLVGALLVGACVGRSLAMAWNVPAIGVHHMEGHLLAPMLAEDKPEFPFVALLVSGGHSQLIAVRGLGRYELIGETLDDAAGEAFDKTAKMMGLPYPGGPALAALAENGNSDRFPFPRPMTDRPGLDMSFSGLKTHTLVTWQQCQQTDQDRADVAAGFQKAVVETLTIKCRRAMEQTGFSRLVIAGGVGANRSLRERLNAEGDRRGFSVFYPPFKYCTDNGAMIALAGALRLKAGETTSLAIETRARWPLEELEPIDA